MKLLLTISTLFATSGFCFAGDTIRFDMFLFGDRIGAMTVSHEVKADGSEFYVLESKAKAKILWIERENYTRYEVTYRAGKLISSTARELENGEVKSWANVKWNGSKYSVENNKGKSEFTEAPTYSIVTICFKDIRAVKRIFYEADACFYSLTKSDESDSWEFESNDGSRNVYHFKSGKIQKMEFHVTFATVKLIRKN